MVGVVLLLLQRREGYLRKRTVGGKVMSGGCEAAEAFGDASELMGVRVERECVLGEWVCVCARVNWRVSRRAACVVAWLLRRWAPVGMAVALSRPDPAP